MECCYDIDFVLHNQYPDACTCMFVLGLSGIDLKAFQFYVLVKHSLIHDHIAIVYHNYLTPYTHVTFVLESLIHSLTKPVEFDKDYC